MLGDRTLPFGKYSPVRGGSRTLNDIPSDYLEYLMEQEEDSGWVSDRYGDDLISDIEQVLEKRTREDAHWHEMEEPYDRQY